MEYQELFHATTMNDGFQNGGPFGMADWNCQHSSECPVVFMEEFLQPPAWVGCPTGVKWFSISLRDKSLPQKNS